MKNMVLLIDANVILNYLLAREPESEYAKKIIDFCRTGKIHGYMAFHTVSIVWYALRKKPVKERRQILFDLCKMLTVTGASHEAVIAAIEDDAFVDFEDCLQEKCAEEINAEYIVTENTRDFSTSSIPAVTAARMVDILLAEEHTTSSEG